LDRSRPDTDAYFSHGEESFGDAADDYGHVASREQAVDFPPMRGGRRHRGLRLLLIGGLGLLVALAGSAGALLAYGRSSIQRSPIAGITSSADAPRVTLANGDTVQVMNVLLIGSDDRSTLSEEERRRLNFDNPGGRRPDTLMLAQLEVGGSGAALLSFPRDLRVELCDGGVDKINASFAAGQRSGVGAESCLVQTVTNLTGIDIHHYVEVDFRGFMQVVDVLGGVSMFLEQPMVDSKAHLNVPAGCVRLTPEQALGFVRSRGYDDDFGRIARQQRFVREVVEELTSIGVLANPPKLFSLVDRAANAVHTDDSLGLRGMRDIALGLRRITSDDVMGQTVPGSPQTIDGVSYVVVDDAEAGREFAAFRDGTAIRPPEASPEPAETEGPVVAEAPPVEVRNGTSVDGLGAAAADVLTAAGLTTGEVGNFTTADVTTTHLLFGEGMGEAAARVGQVFGGVEAHEDAAVEGVILVLGADADRETLAGLALAQTEPTPEPTPTAAPAPETEREFVGARAPSDVDC
jgi:LCP family protein required for cell wall assembly